MPLLIRVNHILVGHLKFDNLAAAFLHFGINRKTFNSRVQAGMDEYEAMTKPVRKQSCYLKNKN